MTRNRKLTALAILAAVTLVPVVAAVAADQPPAPANKVRYNCSGWEWVEFDHPTTGTLRRGTSRIKEPGKPADTKKSTLAYDSSRGFYWEYTINPGGPQCQQVTVFQIPGSRREVVVFDKCNGMAPQSCSRRF